MMRLTIIIPTYNEKENIVPLLDALHGILAKNRRYEITYLVVDDSSPDGTSDTVLAYRKRHPDTFLLTGKKEGLGKALLRGMDHAVRSLKADVLMQMDADLSHDPEKVPEFLDAYTNGYDFVIGSRYIPGGAIPDNWGLHRKLFSVTGNMIVRYGLGHPSLHDWTGGYRMFDRKFYEKLSGEMGKFTGYVFQIAFLHKAVGMGARVYEVPFHFSDRTRGHSKIAPAEYIRNVLLYVGSERWMQVRYGSFGRFMVVGAIGFVINTTLLFVGVKAGLHPSLSAAIGAECAIVSNFLLNNAWTFRDRKIAGGAKGRIGKFLQFNLTSVGAIIIQSGTIWIGTSTFGLGAYFLFYILGVAIGLVWNYLMYSRVIWKKQTIAQTG